MQSTKDETEYSSELIGEVISPYHVYLTYKDDSIYQRLICIMTTISIIEASKINGFTGFKAETNKEGDVICRKVSEAFGFGSDVCFGASHNNNKAMGTCRNIFGATWRVVYFYYLELSHQILAEIDFIEE